MRGLMHGSQGARPTRRPIYPAIDGERAQVRVYTMTESREARRV